MTPITYKRLSQLNMNNIYCKFNNGKKNNVVCIQQNAQRSYTNGFLKDKLAAEKLRIPYEIHKLSM
jgi:hypothetical protein